jgi:hypothetical protein
MKPKYQDQIVIFTANQKDANVFSKISADRGCGFPHQVTTALKITIS